MSAGVKYDDDKFECTCTASKSTPLLLLYVLSAHIFAPLV